MFPFFKGLFTDETVFRRVCRAAMAFGGLYVAQPGAQELLPHWLGFGFVAAALFINGTKSDQEKVDARIAALNK